MGIKLFWKSVIRKRGSLLIFLILLMAVSFGFMLRTVEYLTVNGEIRRISESYRPIGRLSAPDGDITEGAALLEENPYLEFANRKRRYPAVLEQLYNADTDGLSSHYEEWGYGIRISDILVWAEVTDVKEANNPGVYRYDFCVKESVYGYPEYSDAGKRLMIIYGEDETAEAVFEVGKTYLIKACFVPLQTNFDNILQFELKPLEEGILCLEGNAGDSVAQRYVDADAVIQERNRHTMDATGIVDMSALPEVQDSEKNYYLEDGRWLNRQDNTDGKKVCVITNEFAKARNLQVGDMLVVTLQNSYRSFSCYLTDSDTDDWESAEKIEMELEIVGIYGYFSNDSRMSTDYDIMYIPDSLIPEHYEVEEALWEGGYSFVLSSPEVKDAFLQETEKELEARGISCTILENNWEDFYKSATEIAEGVRTSFLVFAFVAVAALIVVGFLYTWQRRREIAIARAVGISAKSAAFGASFPMLICGAFGIIAGGGFAWRYGLEQTQKTLAGLDSGARAELSLFWFASVSLLMWLILSVILLAGNFFYAHKPVLEILQGNPARGQKNQHAALKSKYIPDMNAAVTDAKEMRPASQLREQTVMHAGRRSLFPVMARFVGHHLRRFSLREGCALLTAAVFITASGWMCQTLQNSEDRLDKLYCTTIVRADITKPSIAWTTVPQESGGAFIRNRTVKAIVDTGFVKDSYLVAAMQGRAGRMNPDTGKVDTKTGMKQTVLYGISDIGKFQAEQQNQDIQIQYGEGYSAELFDRMPEEENAGNETEKQQTVIVPETVWEAWSLHSGEKLLVADSDGRMTVTVTVGGYYYHIFGSNGDEAFLAPLVLLELLEAEDVNYISAELTIDPEKNRELDAFREEAKAIVESSGAGLVELSLVLRDSELRQVVEPMEKNINLMKLLYPIVNIVSFLIAGGLAMLFMLQRRREAAILRVLGVGRTSVRLTLASELLILNLAGVLLGLLSVFAVAGSGNTISSTVAAGAYFLGGMIGLVAGCILITGARPLELLQVKE